MFSAGFEPATQAIKKPHTYVLDSTTTGIGFIVCKHVFVMESRAMKGAMHITVILIQD